MDPHPEIVTLKENTGYMGVPLYSYYTTITGWGGGRPKCHDFCMASGFRDLRCTAMCFFVALLLGLGLVASKGCSEVLNPKPQTFYMSYCQYSP